MPLLLAAYTPLRVSSSFRRLELSGPQGVASSRLQGSKRSSPQMPEHSFLSPPSPATLEEASTMKHNDQSSGSTALTLQRLLFALLKLLVTRRTQSQLPVVEEDLVLRRRDRLSCGCVAMFNICFNSNPPQTQCRYPNARHTWPLCRGPGELGTRLPPHGLQIVCARSCVCVCDDK